MAGATSRPSTPPCTAWEEPQGQWPQRDQVSPTGVRSPVAELLHRASCSFSSSVAGGRWRSRLSEAAARRRSESTVGPELSRHVPRLVDEPALCGESSEAGSKPTGLKHRTLHSPSRFLSETGTPPTTSKRRRSSIFNARRESRLDIRGQDLPDKPAVFQAAGSRMSVRRASHIADAEPEHSYLTPEEVSFDFDEPPSRYDPEIWNTVMGFNYQTWTTPASDMLMVIALKAVLGSLREVMTTLGALEKAWPHYLTAAASRKKRSTPRKFRSSSSSSSVPTARAALDVMHDQFKFTASMVAMYDQVYSEMCIKRAKQAGLPLPDSLGTLGMLMVKQRRVVEHLMRDVLYAMEHSKIPRSEAEEVLPRLHRYVCAYYNQTLLWAQVMLHDIVFAVRRLFTEQEWERREGDRMAYHMEDMSPMQLLGMLAYHIPSDRRGEMVAKFNLSSTAHMAPVLNYAIKMHERAFVRPLKRVHSTAAGLVEQGEPAGR